MSIDIFLDRDGTLIRDTGYISKIDDVEVLPGVILGLKLFKANGYRLHIVSNQSGVPRGKISEIDFKEVESYVNEFFKLEDIVFDSLNYCFHLPTDGCECRKPNFGLLEKVSEQYTSQRSKSAMLGNSEVDMQAAKGFGIPFWKTGVMENDFYLIARKVVDYFEAV
jgi:D-glycero-D-manno-heptose 1,7-bisphosphate phosphatase